VIQVSESAGASGDERCTRTKIQDTRYKVSMQRIGYASDADCAGDYLRLVRLAGCLDSNTNHKVSVLTEALHGHHGIVPGQLRARGRGLVATAPVRHPKHPPGSPSRR
jgi:hypothetical protein